MFARNVAIILIARNVLTISMARVKLSISDKGFSKMNILMMTNTFTPHVGGVARSVQSFVLPIPGFLTSAVEKFRLDIVHAQHPFLIGGTALRLAHTLELPLVFTHHTLYEQYTHYVPADSRPLKRFVIDLSTRYPNLCEHVFAPSESVASILIQRGVETPIDVVILAEVSIILCLPVQTGPWM
jgi:1,2-diacylglycerol 3-alpha-glucosyltransferase